jgi:hypothetical protein
MKNAARASASPALRKVLEHVSMTLGEIMRKMPKSKPKIGGLENEYHYWKGLREEFENEIDRLAKQFSRAVGTQDTQHISFNSLDD